MRKALSTYLFDAHQNKAILEVMKNIKIGWVYLCFLTTGSFMKRQKNVFIREQQCLSLLFCMGATNQMCHEG